MAREREATRERDREEPNDTLYPAIVRHFAERNRVADEGAVVIKGASLRWWAGPQGHIKHYTSALPDSRVVPHVHALQEWQIFCNDIRVHSGRHIHQGGLGLHVLEGRGYTIMNGERVDWEEGDLVLLPVLPGGIEHQHFNNASEGRCIWLAKIYWPFLYALGSEVRQVSTRPGFEPTALEADAKNDAQTGGADA